MKEKKKSAKGMREFQVKKQEQIRRIMKEAEPVSRIFRENRFKEYYSAQYINRPSKDILKRLWRFSNNVEVKFSRIGIGGTSLWNPDAYVPGYRLNVYL